MADESVQQLRTAALGALAAAADAPALDAWRIEFLGRKGRLTGVLRGLAALSIDERKALGAAANALKQDLEAAFDARAEELRRDALAASIQTGRIDVTLPARPHRRGSLHPVTRTLRKILDAFRAMGFSVVEGPEVELDYYNFEALRIPADHPARDMWDTMWVDEQVDGRRPLLLRTHTSPMQIRFMEGRQPPIRVAVPGRAYRFEATDTTHEWMMTQVEVLAVDEGLSLAHLKGTLLELMHRLFGGERKVRLQCSYFPFVEPGAEVAVDCFVCNGAGCASCHHTGWIEMMGAGMVHPEILQNMGIDAARYTGFAAGMGVERLAMQLYGVDDIRTWYQNDLRVLQQV
ncbi:MAG TPA: phenylalanine--tRNA ligase subunit alpha [Dehalococcoidia bacterium]|nr:phenylalanine--tRNA ligase subunit alpha [Dehalococcoidia bacterium]